MVVEIPAWIKIVPLPHLTNIMSTVHIVLRLCCITRMCGINWPVFCILKADFVKLRNSEIGTKSHMVVIC